MDLRNLRKVYELNNLFVFLKFTVMDYYPCIFKEPIGEVIKIRKVQLLMLYFSFS